MSHHIRIAVFALGVFTLTVGCKKQKTEESEPEPHATATEEKPQDEPQEATKEASASKDLVATVMKPYEECRALLAADEAKGIADCAKAMAGAARSATADAPDRAKEPLASIVSAADALAAAGTDDIEKTRKLYGDVSKAVVALLTAVPEAATDYHVFECPMAKGYKRWAQTDAKMANPYMGTKMLECGSEVHDHHEAMGADHMMDDDADDGHMMDGDHHDMH